MKRIHLTPVLLYAFIGATRSAHAEMYNLGDLIQNHQSIAVGDKTFDHFTWSSTHFGDGNPLPASEVTITGLDDDPYLYGIRISAPLHVSGTGSSDGELSYSVTAAPGHLIAGIHQLIDGDGDGLAWNISSTEYFSYLDFGLVIGQISSFKSGYNEQPEDAANVGPVYTVSIQKEIIASATLGEAYIDFVDQRFSQIGWNVPDAGSTFSLLSWAVGVFGLVVRRHKKD